MRKFFSKIFGDFRQMFRYPQSRYSATGGVDYGIYWQERRGKDAVPVISDWQKQRVQYVQTVIPSGATVIDIGCGDGAVLAYLQKHHGVKGLGVDIDAASLEQARTLGVETLQRDIADSHALQDIPDVEYVTGFEILEHLPRTEEVLRVLMNKASKGVIFSVPNTGYYVHRFRLLFGRFPLQWVAHPAEHLRFWTVRDMKFWIASLGYEIDQLILYEGIPLLNRLWPSLFAQGMIVSVKKKNG